MIFKKKYLIIFSFFIIGIIIYGKTSNLLKFNKISLKNNVNVNEKLFFDFIEYNSDSTIFYNKTKMDDIYLKIKNSNRAGIINDLKISYSLPNQIFVYIDENKPIFMIKTDINQFIIDDKGKIFDSTLVPDLLLPDVNLNFSDKVIYHKWENDALQIKTLMANIYKNKSNNQSLINSFNILKWISNNNLYSNQLSILINKNTIDVNLDETKIIFSRGNNIKNQINKINKIINNKNLLDSLKINHISNVTEINLCFNNQIVIKS